jgi:hypothetical protein
VLSADDNVYAQAPQPPSIEDALVYFVRDLHMRMPLALLLSTHVSTELPILAKEVDYVESTQIRGQAAHHLAGRGIRSTSRSGSPTARVRCRFAS